MKQTIARNLKRLRGKLRQKEVAAIVGVKLTTYQSWEYGRCEPGADALLKLYEFYKLQSLGELLKEPTF